MVVFGKNLIADGDGAEGSGGEGSGGEGIVARVSRRVSESSIANVTWKAASDTGYVVKKLAKSTGKAAWIASTTLLILVFPLLIESEREGLLAEMDLQQQALLGSPPPTQSQ